MNGFSFKQMQVASFISLLTLGRFFFFFFFFYGPPPIIIPLWRLNPLADIWEFLITYHDDDDATTHRATFMIIVLSTQYPMSCI